MQKLDALDQALSNGASDAVLAAQFAEVFLELQRAIAHVRAVIAGLSAAGDYLDRTQIKSEILGRLSSLMIASRVGATSPLAFVLLQFFGVIIMRHFDADPSIYQLDHVRVIFDWDALTKLFTDPLGLLESRYGWGTRLRRQRIYRQPQRACRAGGAISRKAASRRVRSNYPARQCLKPTPLRRLR